MKKDIHPQLNNVIFKDSSTGVLYKTLSVLKSEVIEKVDGVDHFLINVDVSSSSHPFFTGKENIIDTAGRVEKFKLRKDKKEEGKVKKERAKDKKEKVIEGK